MASMLGIVTITAKTGPGITVTSQVLSSVSSINVDFAKQVLTVWLDSGPREFDLYGIATVTYTIASHVATITLS